MHVLPDSFDIVLWKNGDLVGQGEGVPTLDIDNLLLGVRPRLLKDQSYIKFLELLANK